MQIPWNKGKRNIYSKETRKRMGLANKGKNRSPATEFKRGQMPWNKNTKGLVKPNKGSFRKGQASWSKGKSWSKEMRRKISERTKEAMRQIRLVSPQKWRDSVMVGALKRALKPNLNPSDDLAYILGVLKGDGCVSINRSNNAHFILLEVTSLNFAQSFSDALELIGLNPHISKAWVNPKSWGKKEKYLARAISKRFVEWYKRLSLKEIEGVVSGYEVAFIRGFYESEGSVGHSRGDYGNKWKLAMYNSNRNLLEMVNNLLWKIGFRFYLYGPYIASNPTSKPYYVLNTAGKDQIFRFLNTIKPSIKNLSN